MQISRSELESIIIQELKSLNLTPSKPSGASGALIGILRSLSRGLTDPMKEEAARRILAHLEIDSETPLAKVFINFIGNLSFDDLAAIILSAERCPVIATELGDALAETIIEAIPTTLGIDPKGHMARIIREALSTALAEELGAKITEALCNIDFSDLLDDLPGGKFLKRLIFRN